MLHLFMLEGDPFGISLVIYKVLGAFWGTLMLCFLLKSPKEAILLKRFLLMSSIIGLTLITSHLFLLLTPFILGLMVDWVCMEWIGNLTKLLPILIVFIFVKLAITIFFLGEIMIIILFYLVCLMMLLLLDPLLSDFFSYVVVT